MGKNKSMEAKRIKRLKQSKARPRALRQSMYQKVHQSVDRSKIPLQYQGLFEYRTRAKGLLDPYLEALFPGSTKAADERTRYLDSITEEPNRPLCITLVDGKFRKVLKRFDARMNCIEFVEYIHLAKLIRFSITYSNDDRAMDCYAGGSIHWKTTIHLGVDA